MDIPLACWPDNFPPKFPCTPLPDIPFLGKKTPRTFLSAEHHSPWAASYYQFKVQYLNYGYSLVIYIRCDSGITRHNTWDRCVHTWWWRDYLSYLRSMQDLCVSVLCLFSLPEYFVVPSSMSFGDVTSLANKCVNTRPPVIHSCHLAAAVNNLMSSVVQCCYCYCCRQCCYYYHLTISIQCLLIAFATLPLLIACQKGTQL